MRQSLRATRGAIAFLTRVPIDHDASDWGAFRSTPATFPLVGWLVGAVVALPFLATDTVPGPTVAGGYLLAVYLLTGIHHLDGVADLGDALAVHGEADRRRAVLKDTMTGVGALCAVSVVIAALALGGLALAEFPPLAAIAVVIAAEVGAKLGMAGLACFGAAAHEGMGAQFLESTSPTSFAGPALLATPVVALTWPEPTAALALGGALLGAAIPAVWATRALGGVTGDVFGAANEVGRVIGIHVGVIAWTLW